MYLKPYPALPQEQEQVVSICIDCGMTVHRVLGPGYYEKIYWRAFQWSSM